MSERWFRFPWLILLVALALTGLGIAGIYAATAGGTPVSFWSTRGATQLIWLAVALVVFGLALIPSYTKLAVTSYVLYAFSVAVLVGMAVVRSIGGYTPGVSYPVHDIRAWIHPIHGAYSWITIPGTGISLQPSELMKIAFIMSLAYYLRYRKNYRTFQGLLIPFGMALLPTAFILYASDLGTAMLFLPVLFLMLFAAGAKGRHLLAIMLIGLAMVPIFYSSLKGYQRMRIDSWLLQGCAERLHFELAETMRGDADEPAADALPAPTKPGQPAPAPGDAAAKAQGRTVLTAERKAEVVREITGMWRFRLWRLATDISWGKDKPEFAAQKEQLFKALDAGPGPHSFSELSRFFGSMLNDFGLQQFQAEIAAGNGGLAGQGWLEGTQTRYGKLPEAHTDFLFPTLAEQFGFIGALGILILYGLLLALGIDVSFSTTEPYGKLLTVGVVALLAGQSFLNMAMSIGLMPITGIPLPLMSYGGSSLVSSFLALGLLCNVAMRRLFLIAPRPFEWRE